MCNVAWSVSWQAKQVVAIGEMTSVFTSASVGVKTPVVLEKEKEEPLP